MHKCHIIHVYSGQEKKVKKKLEEAIQQHGYSETISEVLMPTEQVSKTVAGKARLVEKPIMPGYLIIRMRHDDDSWAFVKNIPGVLKVFETPLTDSEAREMLQMMEAGSEGAVNKPKFAVGHKVKIIQGPFESRSGVVMVVDNSNAKLTVNVSIFGRETPVELGISDVEEASES